MHILIAPNAFKNALGAAGAAAAIAEGLQRSRLDCTCTGFPIADGGDGTGPLIVSRCGGQMIACAVHDPFGRPIQSQFGLIDQGKTAVIEMADASGLRLLQPEELNPMQASSAGTGELIRCALDAGAERIVIAMGGSATVDGGCGILHALGTKFYNADEEELSPVPEQLSYLKTVDTSGLDKRLAACEVVVLCDVNNQLLGQQGAAAVFGPQKGADPDMVVRLDAFLNRLGGIALKQYGRDLSTLKYGGTAGGAAAGLYGFAHAELVNGIEYFMQLTGFENVLNQCDLLVTGEGSIDSQTLQGKGPFGVAKMAKRWGIPVVGLAGSIPLHADAELAGYFDSLMAIGNEPVELKEALKKTRENLVRTAESLGNLLAVKI